MSGIKRSRVKIEKYCRQCNTQFFVPNYRKNIAVYCSRNCQALASREKIITTCVTCGNEFTHISSRANKAKYCSRSCYHKGQKGKGSIEYTCQHCDKKFLGSPSHKRKFCSRACVNKSNKSVWNPSFITARKAMASREMIMKCNRCGYSDCPEILGVHHRDRNRKNNNLENLEVLCPNCHSLEHRKHIAHGAGH